MTFSINGNTVITSDRIVQLTSGATGSRPASPVVGQMFFDTTLSKIIVWNGAVWREAVVGAAVEVPAVWTWGGNFAGRLGDGTTTSRSSPVTVVGGFTDWIQIEAGGAHCVAIRSNGTAWAWGYNNFDGRLGDGTLTASRLSPVSVVGGFTDWIQVSSGLSGSHTLALRANGTAWAWGSGSGGKLGDNASTTRSSPVSVAGGFTDWIQVDAGQEHSLALRSNGTAWAWGSPTSGKLGDNNYSTFRSSPVSVLGGFTDWVQISGGYNHSAAVRANGTAWCWGNGGNGRLGDGTTLNKSSPVSVIGGFTDWIQISAGDSHTAAIRANGTAWAWGNNNYGRLGDNTVTGRSSPVTVVGGFTDWVQIDTGSSHTVAIRANGTAWAWGYGGAGRLGNNSTTSRRSPVSVVGGFTDWVQISTGYNHVAALRSQPKTQTVRSTNQRNTF